MSAGRRGLLLSAAFFGAALALCPAAHAQPPDPGAGRHNIWQRGLDPEQIRRLLAQFGRGDAEADKQLEDLIRDRVTQKNPNVDKERLDATIKRMMADKEFMNRMADLAQKQKNEHPNRPPELTPEDLDKLRKLRPGAANGGDPFKLPKEPPPFDPERLPGLDPKNPPAFNPNNPLRPGNPPEPEPAPPFDPENPLGMPKDSPEKIAKTKAVETATALWEKNVGPIEESPAVRKAILELVSDPEAMDALTDGNGKSIFDALRDDGEGMNDLFGDAGGWEWPKLDLKMDWGGSDRTFDIGESNRSRSRWPDASGSSGRGGSSMGGMGSFDMGGMRVPWLLALVLMAMIAAAVLWWKWEAVFPSGPPRATAAGGAGPWPLDPRAINTRDDIVKAFEYLSVLICGPGARTWTHSTIADELSALAASCGGTALKLARLYELARYAPLDEPLTRAEILEARRLACDLAGVDEA